MPSIEATRSRNAVGQAARQGGFTPEGGPRFARRTATYAALDLGTNNCRLLVARPIRDDEKGSGEYFRIVDAFSRIVRLGEGLSQTGRLSEPAIQRTIDALLVCREKMAVRGVTRARMIATEACRAAANGADFIELVRERTGLELEIISRETEARLAAAGCASLADSGAKSVVLFDIGGGSSEILARLGSGRVRRGARSSLDVAPARRCHARRAFRRRRGVFCAVFGDDRSCRGGIAALPRPSVERGKMPAIPFAWHIGYGHDARRCSSQSAAL